MMNEKDKLHKQRQQQDNETMPPTSSSNSTTSTTSAAVPPIPNIISYSSSTSSEQNVLKNFSSSTQQIILSAMARAAAASSSVGMEQKGIPKSTEEDEVASSAAASSLEIELGADELDTLEIGGSESESVVPIWEQPENNIPRSSSIMSFSEAPPVTVTADYEKTEAEKGEEYNKRSPILPIWSQHDSVISRKRDEHTVSLEYDGNNESSSKLSSESSMLKNDNLHLQNSTSNKNNALVHHLQRHKKKIKHMPKKSSIASSNTGEHTYDQSENSSNRRHRRESTRLTELVNVARFHSQSNNSNKVRLSKYNLFTPIKKKLTLMDKFGGQQVQMQHLSSSSYMTPITAQHSTANKGEVDSSLEKRLKKRKKKKEKRNFIHISSLSSNSSFYPASPQASSSSSSSDEDIDDAKSINSSSSNSSRASIINPQYDEMIQKITNTSNTNMMNDNNHHQKEIVKDIITTDNDNESNKNEQNNSATTTATIVNSSASTSDSSSSSTLPILPPISSLEPVDECSSSSIGNEINEQQIKQAQVLVVETYPIDIESQQNNGENTPQTNKNNNSSDSISIDSADLGGKKKKKKSKKSCNKPHYSNDINNKYKYNYNDNLPIQDKSNDGNPKSPICICGIICLLAIVIAIFVTLFLSEKEELTTTSGAP